MKSNLDKFFKSDVSLEKSGIWMDISEETGFLVRRMGGANDRFSEVYAAKTKPYAQQISRKTLDPKKEEKIYIETFVEACLVDWKGIEIDGQQVPFSKEAALKLLSNSAYKDLFQALVQHASEGANYREEQIREDLGNS